MKAPFRVVERPEGVLRGTGGSRRRPVPRLGLSRSEATLRLTEAEPSQVNEGARAVFRAEGSFGDPVETRKRLSGLTDAVLLLGGDLDPAPTPRPQREYVNWFPNGRLVIQPEAGHCPWLDVPDVFVTTVAGFLAGG